MPVRQSGGVFDEQVLTGSLSHWVVCGADFSGAINSFGQPVPGSAAEIIFVNISESAYINIMNPNECNLSFALEEGRSTWDEISLTAMVQSLGTDVGTDHIDCSVCTVKRVPYIWGCDNGAESFLDLTDTPDSYAGYAGYVVTVNPAEDGLIFTPATASNAFAFVASPSQPTIPAVGSDTLTLIAGTNMVITTNALLKTVTFDATGGGSGLYIPVPPATALLADTRYYVTSSGTVTLPLGTGSLTAGTFVKVTKKPGDTVFINAIGADDISTDLGNDTSIEFDATQECVFIFDGTSTWDLQIGSML
jgi:hypothetical protein